MTCKSIFSDLCEFPFKAEVWGNFADWIVAIASVLMLLVACRALTAWKKEKEYDLEMEAKANIFRAIQHIRQFTTLPILSELLVGNQKERYNNLIQLSPDLASCHLEGFLFEQIRQENMKTFIELQTLGERLKFSFSASKKNNEKELNQFYQNFVKACLDISINAFELSELKANKYNGKEFDNKKLDKLNAFFYKGGRDNILEELNKQYWNLNK